MAAEAGRHKEAATVFCGLAELRPDDPRTWMGLGGARYYLGDYQGALEALRNCKKIITSGQQPVYNLAWRE